MAARLLSALLGVLLVQPQAAARDPDLHKVASLPHRGEVGQGGARESSYSSPRPSDPQLMLEPLPPGPRGPPGPTPRDHPGRPPGPPRPTPAGRRLRVSAPPAWSSLRGSARAGGRGGGAESSLRVSCGQASDLSRRLVLGVSRVHGSVWPPLAPRCWGCPSCRPWAPEGACRGAEGRWALLPL